MLPLNKLFEQLDENFLLKLEGQLQKEVSFNSKVLLVFNCAILGQTEEETLKVCSIGSKAYRKYARHVYQTIERMFGLEQLTVNDRLMTELHYTIYEETYVSDFERAKKCELMFHRLKKAQMEQESYPLLFELHQLHIGTPLEAVYEHLYKKYIGINMLNRKGYDFYRDFNQKLNRFVKSRELTPELRKDLILNYKILRNLLEDYRYKNNTLNVLHLLCKFSLVKICGQKQLLFDSDSSLTDLEKECRLAVKKLPFGMERFILLKNMEQIACLGRKEKLNMEYQRDSRCFCFEFPDLAELGEWMTPIDQDLIYSNGKVTGRQKHSYSPFPVKTRMKKSEEVSNVNH